MTTNGRQFLLTPEQELKVLKLRHMGVGQSSLAKRFGVSLTTIYNILQRQREAKGGSQ